MSRGTIIFGVMGWIMVLAVPTYSAEWQMNGRDMGHCNRADFVVPADRQNNRFFDTILWQKPSPGSPGIGDFSSTSMVFFDGTGPGGTDIVVAGYHWPKGVQAMDRMSGELLWFGLPAGGEAIGENIPAFSNDGSVIYVTNNSTTSVEYPNGHPLMAFETTIGPSVYWHNGGMAEPNNLAVVSPTIAPDGRIFLHPWNSKPHAGSDSGTDISEVWAAETLIKVCKGDISLYQDAGGLKVVAASRGGTVRAWDGATGAELWSVDATGAGVDASFSIDPGNGNLYVAGGFSDIYVIGLDIDGNNLWGVTPHQLVYDYVEGSNNPERASSSGCLSHDGATYYFETLSATGEGKLYAINTADGTIKWTLATASEGEGEHDGSVPIVTPNGILVVGNNDGDTYYAVRDDGTAGTVLDTLAIDSDGSARATATLSPDGRLYLPVRITWTVSNGDGDLPSQQTGNVFTAFDLTVIFGDDFESGDTAQWSTVVD